MSTNAHTNMRGLWIALALLSAGPALAQTMGDGMRMLDTCEQYARDTQAFQQLAREKGCHFPDSPRWTDTENKRREWCTDTWSGGDFLNPFDDQDGENIVKEEWRRHRDMTFKCQSCSSYAHSAVEQSMLNKKHNCGGKGTRWVVDRDFHLSWCLQAPVDGRKFEDKVRRDEVKQCTASLGMVRNAQTAQRIEELKAELKKKSKHGRISAVQEPGDDAFEAEPKSLPAGEPLFEELPRGGLGEFPRSADTGGFEPVPIPPVIERSRAVEAMKEKVVDLGGAARDKISDYREAHADEIKATTDKAKVKLKRRLQDVSEAIKERRAESKATAGPSKLKAATKAALTRAVNRSRKSGLLSRLSRR
jgi:hypothetical protein